MKDKGEKLIFIISQPRSGSSLLQQLILNSDKVKSSPEPWFMLNLIYTYKFNNIQSEYNPNFSVINFNGYLESLDGGLANYKTSLKQLALDLYLKKCSGKIFIDKTPRYYHIIEELYDLFPNAKFVFLVRSPLNVFGSILDYNFKGNFDQMLKQEDRLDDLIKAPRKISSAIDKYSNNFLVNYESLVNEPRIVLSKLFKYLELPEPKSMIDYELSLEFNETIFVDKKSLAKHSSPTIDYIDSWKKNINTVQKKVLALDYLKRLNPIDYKKMGYKIEDIIKTLELYTPKETTRFNLNWNYYVLDESKLSIFQVLKKRIYNKINGRRN